MNIIRIILTAVVALIATAVTSRMFGDDKAASRPLREMRNRVDEKRRQAYPVFRRAGWMLAVLFVLSALILIAIFVLLLQQIFS